jgi:hypothetical protein
MATSVGVISLPERRHLSWRAAVAMAATAALVAGAGFAAGWATRSGGSTTVVDRPAVIIPVDSSIRMSGMENPSLAGRIATPAFYPGIQYSGMENPAVAAALGSTGSFAYSGYENPSGAGALNSSTAPKAPTVTKDCGTTEWNIC